MFRILLVEDDPAIYRSLSEYLKTEGFETVCVTGETDAFKAFSSSLFDLVLMDIALSDGSGFSALKRIREISSLPVIFLTASGDEPSTVHGFELGADDYIAKPFRPRELVSRIKNALRRSDRPDALIKAGSVTLDAEKGIVSKSGREIPLSALEYRLLLYLLQNRGKLLTRTRLLEEIWDIAGDFVNDNTLTVYIKRIREKIEDDPANPEIIKTVRGMGYRVD